MIPSLSAESPQDHSRRTFSSGMQIYEAPRNQDIKEESSTSKSSSHKATHHILQPSEPSPISPIRIFSATTSVSIFSIYRRIDIHIPLTNGLLSMACKAYYTNSKDFSEIKIFLMMSHRTFPSFPTVIFIIVGSASIREQQILGRF